MATTSPDAAPASEKQIAVEALGRMPETSSMEEICEELAILAAIRSAGVDADAGRVVGHAEVVRRSAAWVLK
ncbi:MAG: hypothetical protein ACRC7O_11915 [Fimbriiglobus sp.]